MLKGRCAYGTLKDVADDANDGKRMVLCTTVVDAEEKTFKSKKTGNTETYCKLILQQNNDTCECAT